MDAALIFFMFFMAVILSSMAVMLKLLARGDSPLRRASSASSVIA